MRDNSSKLATLLCHTSFIARAHNACAIRLTKKNAHSFLFPSRPNTKKLNVSEQIKPREHNRRLHTVCKFYLLLSYIIN